MPISSVEGGGSNPSGCRNRPFSRALVYDAGRSRRAASTATVDRREGPILKKIRPSTSAQPRDPGDVAAKTRESPAGIEILVAETIDFRLENGVRSPRQSRTTSASGCRFRKVVI